MKRIYLLLISLFTLVICVFSQEESSTLSVIGDASVGAVSTVYNDVKSGISTVYGDVANISGPLYKEVKTALSSIANGIGCAAEHVYSVLIKKYIVEGVSELLSFILWLSILIFGIIKTNKYFQKNDKIDWHCLFPFGLLILGIICVSTINFSEMLVNLINPEWKALEYIIETTKSIVK